MNALAIKVEYEDKHKRCLGTIPADWEANPENFLPGGKRREDRAPLPLVTRVYQGMRVLLTQNLNKRSDFVNGMSAIVVALDDWAGALVVRTRTNRVLTVYLHTTYMDLECGRKRVRSFPLRPGYASTIYKLQGANLEHVTAYLDRPRVPAAAYVAMSRVPRDEDYLIGGHCEVEHFVPAF